MPFNLSRHSKTIACALAIVALALLFMGEALLPDRMLAPLDIVMSLRPWSKTEFHIDELYNALPSDKVFYIHPIKVFVGQAWRTGQLPLWEPRMLAGYPIIGNAQAGIFYPLTLPYVVLSGADASDLVALLHLVIAGWGLFAYLRVLSCRHLAALLGAIVFMFNQVMMVWLMWDSVAGAMVWLPWALWAFEMSLRPACFWMASLGAVAVCLTFLGGHFQWSLYAVLILVLFSLFRFALPRGSRRRRVLLAAIVIIGLGTALATLQILPTLEYIRDGHRGYIPFERMQAVVSWSDFMTLWIPKFFGEVLPPRYWGPMNYNETVVYVGVAPLLLAVAAITLRRDTLATFFAGLSVLGVLGATGTDVYRLLHILPGFDSLMPVRMRYLVVIGLSVLCGLGLDWLLRRPPRAFVFPAIAISLGLTYAIARIGSLPTEADQWEYLYAQEGRFAIVWLSATALLLLCTGFRSVGRFAPAGICALTLIDLWLPGVTYQQPISTRYYFPATPGIQMMLDDPDQFRVISVKSPDWFAWELRPNMAGLFNLQDVAGYDSVYSARFARYLESADPTGPPFTSSNYLSANRFDSPLIDLLNVKYALSAQRERPLGWDLVHTGDMRIYLRTDPLPRAWIAARAEVIADDAMILDRLTAPDFDPRHTVILERDPIEPLGDDLEQLPGTVNIETYENTHLVLTAQMQRDGWLVLSELYHPGWRATVDGAPTELYRADYILRAVPVPAGQYRVELTFLPDSFVLGSGVSGVSALVLLMITIVARRKDRVRSTVMN